jgi:serine/threonine protein kinase
MEMEYANGGSLIQLMQYHLMKKRLLSVKDVWMIFLQILKGVDGSAIRFVLFYFGFV